MFNDAAFTITVEDSIDFKSSPTSPWAGVPSASNANKDELQCMAGKLTGCHLWR